jgi:DNA modification methylase
MKLDLFESLSAEPTSPSASSEVAGDLLSALSAIDWDFRARNAHSSIEGIHPYPAKFITELPRTLLSILPTPPGTSVLDPFCGSGATLVESQMRGLRGIGIDLNPIACLMSRVKTAPLEEGLDRSLLLVLTRARGARAVRIPAIPNVDHWFSAPVQDALARLLAAIDDAPPCHHDVLRLAASSIIVRVSRQESDTRYAAVDKAVTADDVFDAFARAAQRIRDALKSRTYSLEPTSVIEGDVLEIAADTLGAKIGLVVTSPPYPNAYEYWLYHKYRMWWLGYDPLVVKASEIGARAHFFRKNHHTADNFASQMTGLFRLLRAAMVPGGFACFVVGRSRIHGRIVDNASTICRVGAVNGFSRFFSAERVLSANRKSFNLSHANIKTETVLVLRYEG